MKREKKDSSEIILVLVKSLQTCLETHEKRKSLHFAKRETTYLPFDDT